MIGQNISHYRIVSKLGEGGMGEVYEAKDQKLGRDVAIKVLPEEFAKDADRVARFQREAKLLASLNHPNIATIHGLEECEGKHFLVLELVDGDTLADQIKKGPIPAEESLKVALQIAEALEAAHEKGVIHRDLKPANVKVTPEGKVKVLDFGLAKAFAGDQGEMILSDSPTLSVAATQQGIILGTPAYMSPEQARGKSVDKRTDVWAFGVVLFEMLAGRAVFSGQDVSEILAAVIRAEPEWSSLPANLHWRLREVIERCLEKEARNRYGSINDARVDIQKVLADPSGVVVQPITVVGPRTGLRTVMPWIAAAIALGAIISGVVIWKLKPTPPPEPRQVTRFYYELPEGQWFGGFNERAFAVSPDGSQLVYKTRAGLYLRSMGELNARLISGTEENPRKPFFSTDGQWIGYVSGTDGKLKKISVNGGAPVPLTDDNSLGFLDWCADDTIVYATGTGGSIMRISANGGNPELLVKGEGTYFAPQILPDGKTIMYTLGPEPFRILLQSLETGERKELFPGDTAQYLPTGHIVYAVENNLFAIPFDLDRLEVAGGPIPMVEGVFRRTGAPQFAVSDSGTLVYMPGTSIMQRTSMWLRAFEFTLVWVDHQGKEEPIETPPNVYMDPKISPDGTKVALTLNTGDTSDIWIWDLIRETMARLTFNENSSHPLWTPDGQRIAFLWGDEDEVGVYWKAADGTGDDEPLSSVLDGVVVPCSWSSDGEIMVTIKAPSAQAIFGAAALTGMVMSGGRETPVSRARSGGQPMPEGPNIDIGFLSMEGDNEWRPLLQEEYIEFQPQISPNGQWMAYGSNESGQMEIYVRPFPNVNKGRWQVSTSGGNNPLWSPGGRELFYLTVDSVMTVAVEIEPTFKPGKPQALFQRTYIPSGWDIHPDGKRFLMVNVTQKTPDESTGESTAEPPRKINIVLNWLEELKQRVSGK